MVRMESVLRFHPLDMIADRYSDMVWVASLGMTLKPHTKEQRLVRNAVSYRILGVQTARASRTPSL